MPADRGIVRLGVRVIPCRPSDDLGTAGDV
jgi:hypothetical protein